jgi:hypothetical protein
VFFVVARGASRGYAVRNAAFSRLRRAVDRALGEAR